MGYMYIIANIKYNHQMVYSDYLDCTEYNNTKKPPKGSFFLYYGLFTTTVYTPFFSEIDVTALRA